MSKFKLEVPVDLSERTSGFLDTAKKVLHLVTLATTLLTICVVAPMIATEARYLGGGKPGPNYTLFVSIISLPIPFFLVYFPWMYEHHNKFRRPGKFCLKNRTNLIFCGFNSFLWATAGIASAVYSNDASACTVDSDLRETYGDDYVSSWGTQCNLSKVTAAFAWITCVIWLSTLVCTVLSFWKEKQDIQHRLNEHRISKQSTLHEETYTEKHVESVYQKEETTHHYETSSPFNDSAQQIQYQQHTVYDNSNITQHQYSPYSGNHSSPYQPASYENHISPPALSHASAPIQYQTSPPVQYQTSPLVQYQTSPPVQYQTSPSVQYHTSPPVQFSPMPTPQHVMPHPEQTHYHNP
ncbi:hypothetical protein G6F64_005412 [Rhizopus arrhizus]|uniref:MARVEL domain-containing protein n=1 Tax=Rhizopus oryzae TaxID=64495 RepID=A0A9P6XAN7_RHIOR|nr:hypothetical protein G6F64_005412 [Rhizopus arrhizus]